MSSTTTCSIVILRPSVLSVSWFFVNANKHLRVKPRINKGLTLTSAIFFFDIVLERYGFRSFQIANSKRTTDSGVILRLSDTYIQKEECKWKEPYTTKGENERNEFFIAKY